MMGTQIRVCVTLLFILGSPIISCDCVSISPKPPMVSVGKNVSSIPTFAAITCAITDAPLEDLDIRWQLPNGTYLSNTTGRFHFEKNMAMDILLVIEKAFYQDNGTYSCEAKNSLDDNSMSASVELVLLVYLDAGEPVSIFDNVTSAELKCDMAGFIPEDSALKWYRNGELVVEDERVTVSYTPGKRSAARGDTMSVNSIVSVLTFTDPNENDTGEYECRIEGYDLPKQTVQLAVNQLDDGTSSPVTENETEPSEEDDKSDSNDSALLTAIIAAVAGFLGLIVIVLIIIIVAVACQRCRQSEFVIQEPSGPTVTILPPVPSKDNVDTGEEPPPVPVRTYSQSEKYAHSGSYHQDTSYDMPDLIRSQSHTRQPQGPQVQYDMPETKFSSSFPYYDKSEDNPRIIPPEKPPVQSTCKSRRTYYDEVNLLKAENRLPGASGFSLSTVPSPHDVLSGSLQRQQNPPDFSYPIYQDGFTPEDLAPYDSVEHDYDQIYSEPIEPGMLNVTDGQENPVDAIPYSAIYDDPKPLGQTEAPLEITMNNIIEIKKLGTGQFGQVILARTKNLSLMDMKLSETNNDRSHSILVAVKKLKTNAETGLFESFEKEVKFMSRLNHDNVVRLLGVCRISESFIMMEYMENGDLNQFLQKHSLVPDIVEGLGEWEITPIILLYIGVQISSGLHYLASRRFVHRDLATRNCLVGKDFVVKISDFGMSRRLYESAYYRVQGTLVLPIRWMACETFYGKFSVKSDAWAFGVTLWEIYTLASCDPYEDMTDEEVIQDAIRGPNRKLLPRPDVCPREVYDVLLRSWVHDPSMRADFGEIYSRLYMIYTSQAL